jgi:hypothetical protein
MNAKSNNQIRKFFLYGTVLTGMMLALCFGVSSSPVARAQGAETPVPTPVPKSEYFTVITRTLGDGKSVDEYIINGPPTPPPGYEFERAAVALPKSNRAMGTKTLTVPAFNWVFGCSAVSGAMIAGYYDRTGFPNMYTGPTNGGIMPLDNSSWPTWSDGYTTYPNLPLAASHQGVDGRATRGSIDDYWVKYGSSTQDPYITNGWTQHTWGDAIGDYMKTSQSAYGNTDGSTNFWNWTSSATQFTCANMVTYGYSTLDGTYGRKLFYEARGYTVTDCYNQKTDNNGGGFTFALYKAEIDANRPVMLNLEGHTIAGVGYDDSSNTVYIHDTWDYNTHTMTWGGSYSGMSLMSVSVVNIQTATATNEIYLPLVLKDYSSAPPPLPGIPTLNAISNGDGDGNYDVTWSTASNATTYILEEDDNSGFTSPTTVYNSTGTSWSASGKSPGTYYYHVKAHNATGDSGWSGTQSTTVALGPTPGFWESTTGDEFYVTPSGTYVTHFAIYISVSGCGTYKITHVSPDSLITSNQFSYSGTFYYSGTFDSATAAHGTDGLSSFYISGCGYVTGGPWSYNAVWKNSTQPTASARIPDSDTVELVSAIEGAHQATIVVP